MTLPRARLVALFIAGLLLAQPAAAALDPQLRAARFEQAMGQTGAAIARLQVERRQAGGASSDELNAMLAELYLTQGLYRRAGEQLRQLAKADDGAWLRLAQLLARAGDIEGALQALARITDELPPARQRERLLLEGELLLRRGRLSAAEQRLGLLLETGRRSDEAAYGRFDLAVARYRGGDTEAARELLDALGRDSADSSQRRALRDKANLTLGFDRLQAGEVDEAADYFKRARLNGPLSSTALLGLGRAYASEEAYKKALVPWLRLSKRDPADPAVQDALLAVPYALGKLNAYKQALQYYNQAVGSFQLETERLAKIEQAVKDGSLVQSLVQAFGDEPGVVGRDRLRLLPATAGASHLWQLFSTNRFQADLWNSAQIARSLEKIQRWTSEVANDDSLPPARRTALLARATDLETRLQQLSHQFQQHMQDLALEELSRRRERIKAYAEEARFSIAQIYDYSAKRWGER